MKAQWGIIVGLLFTLLIAVFAVANVENVEVNFLYTEATVPLIIVILTSVLLGGIMVGSFGIFRQYRLQRKISQLQQEVKTWKERFEAVSKAQLKETRKQAEAQNNPMPTSESSESNQE